DIKPENIGIGESGGTRSAKRLRLFDFSLAAAAPTELRVGTLDYLDPFLADRKARRYDLSAELYAVAITLHELATGERARWKGGQPQLTAEEITLRSELFDADLRDQFTRFFRTALNRDYRKRHDNAREMLRAWRAIFETVDRSTAHTVHDRPPDEGLSEEVLKYATPATQLGTLMLSTRLMNVLERLNIHSIGELLRFKFGRFEKFRGVGRKTQRELFKVMHRLRQRFPEVELGQGETIASVVEPLPVGLETIEVLARHALLVRRGRANVTEVAVLHPFLGVDATVTDPSAWPSQSDLAQSSGVTRQRIGQIITTARRRWADSAPLTGLRDTMAEVLRSRGGVMTQIELVNHVLSVRGSLEEEPQRTRLANAAVRAAVEAEHACESPRFDEYRSGDKIFVALHPELRTYAVKLGRVADELAAMNPLPTPSRVLDELRAVAFPDDVPELAPPADARLRQLAVSAAHRADLSSRGEIYPPGFSAAQALPLARNGLFGDELTVQEIERRLRARFPQCGPLPPRPELDGVLKEAGFDFEWQPLAANQQGAYRSPAIDSLSASYSIGSRKTTQSTVLPGAASDPDIAQAAMVERRLRASATEGGYLVLTAEVAHLELATRELEARFEVEICDLDALVLEALHAEAEAIGAQWEVVLAADAAPRASADWQNLQYLVERALPKVEQRLRSVRKTCLALHPGLLARYGHMNLIASLAADIGRAGGPGGLWVLAPANDSHALPTLNGVPIPVTSPNQHTRLTIHWLRNEHRAGVPVGE
ncbi:MAG TPA: BREX system serine/threonine kinase PglW, partial [Verrucomicrobiales bacterium]|nr:BREX system serine/threonine kinase PglW [Verrucomicrobiales bacterium]